MRLIDANALMEQPVWFCGGWVGDSYAEGYMDALDKVEETIKSAPTIDVVPKWIPCEERLPEPNVAVLGYAPAFQNIFAVYYDSVCGWMTWCPACYEPFPISQGEIVAWMPLPEPYEGERKDDEADRR